MSDELRHLHGSNLKLEISACIGYVHFWGITFDSVLREIEAKCDADIRTAKEVADSRSGWRCATVEILLSAYCEKMSQIDRLNACQAICQAAIDVQNLSECQAAINTLNGLRANLGQHLLFYVAPGKAFNIYLAQTEYPSVSILKTDEIAPVGARASAKNILDECKSPGQRQVLKQITELAQARMAFSGEVAGIKILPVFTLVGMSGSGKTFLARQFARASNYAFFETTISGWAPANSKTEPEAWTLRRVQKILDRTPLVLLCDELDKISTRDGRDGGNLNWYASCQTELMGLLDRVGEGFTLTQKCHLERSWIICAGAFQNVFRKKIGESVSFAEELENIEITRADLEEHSGLPDELLNRILPIYNLPAPRPDDLLAVYAEIDAITGADIGDKARVAMANEAIAGMKGFRGLAEYAIISATASLKKKTRRER